MARRKQPVPNTAVAYYRLSTDEDLQRNSFDVQRAAVEAWAGREGVTLVDSRFETVSGAAALDRRPGLGEALALVQSHHAPLLVVHRLDRFSRDAATATMAGLELERMGARLHVVEGAANGDDPTSVMIRGILIQVASFERAMIAARVKAALAVKKTRGEMVGVAPYGFQAAPSGKISAKSGKDIPILVPHPEEQATLARLKEWKASGLSLRAIAELASIHGLRGRRGQSFTAAAIWSTLKFSENALTPPTT